MNEANLSVMVLSYIEGYPADEFIWNLSDMAQFNIGLAAGKELRKIHQLHAHAPQTIQWEEAQKRKFSFYLNEYRKDSYQLPKEHKILNFIENNFYLLKERPRTLLHDDFHLGHIIVQNNTYNGVDLYCGRSVAVLIKLTGCDCSI
ncbi:phosphotransferase [Lysinibacillus sp. NPDC056959]|uniref:phosphotransferase n=1 Tax=Lysinibacillus sp. NPDC056959 TaxID=3345981 RepID=UPI00363F59EB